MNAIAPLLLFISGLIALVLAWLVHAPPRRPGELAVMTFGWSWWGGELPIHVATVEVILALVLVVLGALDHTLWMGILGLIGILVGLGAAVLSWRQADRVRQTLSEAIGAPITLSASRLRLVFPIWFGDAEVECQKSVPRDGERLTADIYRPRRSADGAPILVYVHGGGWVLGFRRFQGRLLIRRLVRAGWVCVSIEYRLAPFATWPAHIIDVKRAIAWVRRMAPSWNADPSRIAISGNSAGGHLSTLAALSPGFAPFQPGFEHEDTRVSALIAWYGVYDLLDAAKAWPHAALRRLWEILIVKHSARQNPDPFRLASPIHHLSPESPPTLIIHGTHDTLVPVASAQAFHEAFERVAPGRSTFWPIASAQHAFEVFWSRRGAYTVNAAAVWLERTMQPRQGHGDPTAARSDLSI